MDFNTFTALFCMLACFLNLSADAQITGWTGTDGTAGTAAITMTAGATAADASGAAFSLVEGTTGTLFKVIATPSNGATSYTITSTPSGIASTTIAVSAVADATLNEGTVVLATGSALDYEAATSIVFVVVASDAASTTNVGTASVTITVTAKVEFTSTVFCLTDTSLISGASVGTIATDTSTAVISTTLGAGTDQASFALTAAGALTTTAALSSYTKVYYVFTASATDATITDSGNVEIHVLLSCPSSGAGRIAALVGVLVLSFATALFN